MRINAWLRPFWLAVIAAMILVGCRKQSAETGAGRAKSGLLRIAVIPKGTTHEFWKSIHAGAVKAAAEFDNVNITWKGPPGEDDREQQRSTVESFVTQGYDGIVVAPLEDQALVKPVRAATRAGIPVVIIDSGLNADTERP